jgi:hypothetical protein
MAKLKPSHMEWLQRIAELLDDLADQTSAQVIADVTGTRELLGRPTNRDNVELFEWFKRHVTEDQLGSFMYEEFRPSGSRKRPRRRKVGGWRVAGGSDHTYRNPRAVHIKDMWEAHRDVVITEDARLLNAKSPPFTYWENFGELKFSLHLLKVLAREFHLPTLPLPPDDVNGLVFDGKRYSPPGIHFKVQLGPLKDLVNIENQFRYRSQVYGCNPSALPSP